MKDIPRQIKLPASLQIMLQRSLLLHVRKCKVPDRLVRNTLQVRIEGKQLQDAGRYADLRTLGVCRSFWSSCLAWDQIA